MCFSDKDNNTQETSSYIGSEGHLTDSPLRLEMFFPSQKLVCPAAFIACCHSDEEDKIVFLFSVLSIASCFMFQGWLVSARSRHIKTTFLMLIGLCLDTKTTQTFQNMEEDLLGQGYSAVFSHGRNWRQTMTC